MTFTLARAADVSPGDTVLHKGRARTVIEALQCCEMPCVLQFEMQDGLSVMMFAAADVSVAVSP